MKNVVRYKRYIPLLLVVLCIVMCVLSLFFPSFTYADTTQSIDNKFDKTNVLDDLKSSNEFDILDYPFDILGEREPELITFVEYCYNYNESNQNNYGLYVYIYNPQGTDIETADSKNKIGLAVSYNSDSTGNLEANRYEKFDLHFCSKSDGLYKNLFYKFKIIDRTSDIDGKSICERVNRVARRYDISEIELFFNGNIKANSYGIGGSFTFTGFSKGYGSDKTAESTLLVDYKPLRTVQLEVHSTFWRSKSSPLGKDYRNELDSVYFSVPNEYLNEYDSLQKIHASWYETRTNAGWVITNSELDSFDVGGSYHGNTGSSWCIKVKKLDDFVSSKMLLEYVHKDNAECHKGYPVFFKYGLMGYNDCILMNETSFNQSKDPVFGGETAGRTWGLNDVTIDAGDNYDLLSYDETHGFWDTVKDFGFWNTLLGKTPDDSSFKNIKPIIPIERDKYEKYSAELLAQELYVDSHEADAFCDYVHTSWEKGETPFLFRFAVTQYHSEPRESFYYYFDTEIFCDFDIIDLTFVRDDEYFVIPVVASPIDIIGGAEKPIEYDDVWDWFKSLLKWLEYNWYWVVIGIIAVIVLIVLAPFLPTILSGLLSILKILGYCFWWLLKGLWWLISAPFRLLISLFKGGK